MVQSSDTRLLRGLAVPLVLWLAYQVSWGYSESKHEADCNQARLRCSRTQERVPLGDGLDDQEALAEAKRAYKDYDDRGCEEVPYPKR